MITICKTICIPWNNPLCLKSRALGSLYLCQMEKYPVGPNKCDFRASAAFYSRRDPRSSQKKNWVITIGLEIHEAQIHGLEYWRIERWSRIGSPQLTDDWFTGDEGGKSKTKFPRIWVDEVTKWPFVFHSTNESRWLSPHGFSLNRASGRGERPARWPSFTRHENSKSLMFLWKGTLSWH